MFCTILFLILVLLSLFALLLSSALPMLQFVTLIPQITIHSRQQERREAAAAVAIIHIVATKAQRGSRGTRTTRRGVCFEREEEYGRYVLNFSRGVDSYNISLLQNQTKQSKGLNLDNSEKSYTINVLQRRYFLMIIRNVSRSVQ